MKMENIIVIEGRRFLILDTAEDVNTEDTILDTAEYSVESTDCESVELYYITAKPDFQCVGYALEVGQL